MNKQPENIAEGSKQALERALNVNGFEAMLKQLRENISDPIHSKALIRIPFTVQSHIHRKKNRKFLDEAKMHIIDLKAHNVQQYGVQNDIEEFEQVG